MKARKIKGDQAKGSVAGFLQAVEVDVEALELLLDQTTGKAFQFWADEGMAELEKYEAAIRKGFPVDPAAVAVQVPRWQGWLGYSQQRAAAAGSYQVRALAVAKGVLRARGVLTAAVSDEAQVRTPRQAALAGRWKATTDTLQEWLYEARAEKKKYIPG